MKYPMAVLAFLLVLGQTSMSNAQESSADAVKGQGQSYGGCPMMGSGMGGMMRHDMGRMGGPGMIMRPGMMKIMLVLMDTDADGALSLEEVQSVHARMFKAMDADKNGKVTLEEIQQFFRGQ